MNVYVNATSKKLAEKGARHAADILRSAIKTKGEARIILSTGNSQLETINALLKQDIPWDKVEMFHLDEYIGIPSSHPASFEKYLQEKFVSKVSLKAAHFVKPDPACIPELSAQLRQKPVDLGLIGIGENAHIAFNDPPADFNTKDAYCIVELNNACKQQQVGEGWFATLDDVPSQAISMSVHQILQCENIISCVPFAVKAQAIKHTLEGEISNLVPATILKQHPRAFLYADNDSFSLVDISKITGDVIMVQ